MSGIGELILDGNVNRIDDVFLVVWLIRLWYIGSISVDFTRGVYCFRA
jgi:hypothetical protein